MHTKKSRFRLDPRTSLILILAVSTPTFTASAWYTLAISAAVPLSMYVLSGRAWMAAKLAVVYALAIVTDVLIVDSIHGIVAVIVVMFSGVICRMMPVIMVASYVMSSTTVSEFVAAAERMRVPRQIIIPFSVMFRFMPTIREETASISDAMRMRGITLGRTRGGPVALLEYRLIPMIISTVKIGEELSAAALTRGLGAPSKRTNICKIGFGAADLAYIVVAAAVLTMYFVTRVTA